MEKRKHSLKENVHYSGRKMKSTSFGHTSTENDEYSVISEESSDTKTYFTAYNDIKQKEQTPRKVQTETTIIELAEDGDNVPNSTETREPCTNKSLGDSTHENDIEVVSLSDSDDCERDSSLTLSSSLTEGPLYKLWGGKTKPLLQPADAKSTATILSKLDLQMTKQKLLATKSHCVKNIESNTNHPYKIIYDVYLPKTPFRKSNWRSPNYRIAVCKTVDPLPTHKDVQLLTERYEDSVPLLFAVCSLSSVAFYCFSKITLPHMISQG